MEKDREQLIEAYFAQTLTSDQQKRLDWLLKHDRAFSDAFTFEKEVRDAIVYNERQNIKDRFRALDKQEIKPIRKLTAWWYAAASIVVLIGAVWFFENRQEHTTTDKLYAQYMEPYPNMVAPKVRGDIPADKMMAEALALYDKQAYSEASVLLKQLYEEHPDDEITFYLAICHLMLQESNESIQLFVSRSWEKSMYFSPTVINWYLGMAFLQQNDREQALSHFKLVAASGESLSNQANKIIEALN